MHIESSINRLKSHNTIIKIHRTVYSIRQYDKTIKRKLNLSHKKVTTTYYIYFQFIKTLKLQLF